MQDLAEPTRLSSTWHQQRWLNCWKLVSSEDLFTYMSGNCNCLSVGILAKATKQNTYTGCFDVARDSSQHCVWIQRVSIPRNREPGGSYITL